MQYLVRLGRADWAIAQFRHCQTVLAREFGVEPMPETQRLYREILAQENVDAMAAPTVSISSATARAM
jgi:DNA-binding SARP family transcriptional activator